MCKKVNKKLTFVSYITLLASYCTNKIEIYPATSKLDDNPQ